VFESVTYKSTKNYLFLIFSAMNLLHQRIGGHEGISKLLRHFYVDVRQDSLIGFPEAGDDFQVMFPIFDLRVKSSYARPMPMKHLPLRLREEDFERWLFLGQANCRAQLPSDVAEEMIDLASRIAHRLRMILGISVHDT
jgi:truncated hemoglobin YjbI